MSKDFPHLQDTEFPNFDNTNPYSYKNTFDYSRWNTTNAKLKMCNVKWDSGYEHVVKFANDTQRDNWFKKIEGHAIDFDTNWRVQAIGEVRVNVPVDVAKLYNYLTVETMQATTNEPIVNEKDRRVKNLYYFITDAQQLSPSTTQLNLQLDVWTTWVNSVEIPYMMLTRGHEPMSHVDTDSYLSNPISHMQYLSAPDVNFSTGANKTCEQFYDVVNDGEIWACVAISGQYMSGDNEGYDWGSKNGNNSFSTPRGEQWRTPASDFNTVSGVPSMEVIAVKAENLEEFIITVEGNCPQFKQTVQAIYFMPEKLLTFVKKYTFEGYNDCYWVRTRQHKEVIANLTKDSFGYDTKYTDIAKLYTFPYAHLEICDENGNISQVRVEETVGEIGIELFAQIAYPGACIDGQITGFGNDNYRIVNWGNITPRQAEYNGAWYTWVKRWKIPTYAVIQDPYEYEEAVGYYNREHAKLTIDNVYTAALNTADTSEAITRVMNQASSSNTDLNIAYNTYQNEQYINLQNAQLENSFNLTKGLIATEISTEIKGTYLTASQVHSQANVDSINSLVSGNLSGFLTSGFAGTDNVFTDNSGIIASSFQSAAQTAASTKAAMATAQTIVAGSGTIEQANKTYDYNSTSLDNSAIYSRDMTSKGNALTKNVNNNNINATHDSTHLSAELTRANALLSKETATDAWQRNWQTAGIQKPKVFGQYAQTDGAVTSPMMVNVNVVTQSDGAIAQAGEQMLRFGYYANYPIENAHTHLNVMKYFSYWEGSDVWVISDSVSANVMNTIRSIFENGVTIWSNADICLTKAYN